MRNFLMLAGVIVACISALFATRADARYVQLLYEVQTKFDYYVTNRENNGSDHNDDKCVFRNGELLYCPKGSTEYLFLGKPIKTKKYNLIPTYNSCGGTACRVGRASLIIERGERAKALYISECFDCYSNMRVSGRDYRRDKVTFDLGLLEGARITAVFYAGKLSVYRVLEPLELSFSNSDCEMVYSAFEGCASPSNSAIRTQSDANGWADVSQRHPSLFENEILPMCEQVHSGAMSKDVAFHKFCRIKPTWE